MKTIYIDDDATNRTLLRDMLALEDVAMVEAPDARQGLKLIENDDFDLIFMDLRMPDMNGLTAIRQLRSGANQLKNVPIMVVTADPSDGVKALCLGAGADGFLEKPICMDKLSSILASARAGRASGMGASVG